MIFLRCSNMQERTVPTDVTSMSNLAAAGVRVRNTNEVPLAKRSLLGGKR